MLLLLQWSYCIHLLWEVYAVPIFSVPPCMYIYATNTIWWTYKPCDPVLLLFKALPQRLSSTLYKDSIHQVYIYTGWPKNNGTVDFLGLCSDQQLSFFTLLERTSFPYFNNTKIIKFGWKLFILWVISYGLSFSGFAIDFSFCCRLVGWR